MTDNPLPEDRLSRLARLVALLHGWTGIGLHGTDTSERDKALTVLWRAWGRECERLGISNERRKVRELTDANIKRLASLRWADEEHADEVINAEILKGERK